MSTLIALIDTGVGSDSTNTGYVDWADAYNSVDGSNNVTDNYGHGTIVSDFIAKEIQSTCSLAGASPSVQILPIKAYDDSLGYFTDEGIINGIEYAISKHASVINLSMEGRQCPFYGESEWTAIQHAQSANGIAIIAAGNNGDIINGTQYGNQNIDIEQPYPVEPAALPHDSPTLPNAIVATSATSSGNLNSGANYGQNHVDLAAPLPIPNFVRQNTETSFAAGYVSGVAGALYGLHPGSSYSQILSLIDNNVQTFSGLSGKVISGGEISAYNSILAGDPAPTASASVHSTTASLSESDSYGSAADSGLTFTWSVTSQPPNAGAPTFSANNGTNAAKNITATFSAYGSYTFQVQISDGQGFTTYASVPVTVNQTATTVTVSPGTATVADMGTQGFAATVMDQFGATIPSPSVSWSVQAGGVGGTVNQSGTYTAPSSGAGTDTVKATSGSAAGTATVTVTSSGGASSIQVNLASYSSAVGITTPGSTVQGSIADNSSDSLSSQALATAANWTSGQVNVWNGQTFDLGPANANDIVPCSGSTNISIPQGSYTALDVLALSAGYSPSQAGVFTLFYSDGSSDQYTQGVSEWTTGYTGVGGFRSREVIRNE